MKACTGCGSTTNGYYKNSRAPDGLKKKCKVCCLAQFRDWHKRHPEKHKEYHVVNAEVERRARLSRYKANPEKGRAACRRFYMANREREIRRRTEWTRKWQRENPELVNAKNARWRKQHRDKCNVKFARYRATKLNATPPWVNLGAIESVYAEAAKKTRETGIVHHVDHIVPLRGKTVCGLHVPWNLQVLPATENARKANRLLEQ